MKIRNPFVFNKKDVINISPEMITLNAMSARLKDMQSQFGVSKEGERDLNAAYGYKVNPVFNDYLQAFKRSGMANRLCSSLPRSCWRDGATIMADDKEVLSDEMLALTKLGMFLKLENSDILNRIGSFSVLFVGIPDGLSAKDPLGAANANQLDDVYFTAYAENSVTISSLDNDPSSPRFGLPETYQLTPQNQGFSDKEITTKNSIIAHWSRVVHMAEGGLTSDIYGMPYLEPVYDRICDLNKVTGGASEAYFRNAVGKFALEVAKEAQGNLDSEGKKNLKDEIAAFTNNMQNFMRLNGMSAKPLTSPQQDPTGTRKGIIEELSGYSGIPIRILTGEGGGQLAGHEDKESYNAITGDRQNQICEPWLERLLSIFDEAGMIELPENYDIVWPVVESLNEKDKAEISASKARALNDLSSAIGMNGGLEGELTPEQALVEVMGLEYLPEAADDTGEVE